MQKRTREIIALVMLVVLGIAGIAAMTWYILVGHNWNAAASLIDDHIGTMDGYTVVLYEGTLPYRPEQDAAGEREVEGDSEWESEFVSTEAPVGEAARTIGAGDLLTEDAVTVEKAVAAYTSKDAQTVRVHIDDFGAYADPIIVERNGRRIAIFSVESTFPDVTAHIVLQQLQRYDIDVSICLTDDLRAVKRGFGDVSIAICTAPEAFGQAGYIHQTYVVGSPIAGDVGAVLVSPSGFISSKTLEAL